MSDFNSWILISVLHLIYCDSKLYVALCKIHCILSEWEEYKGKPHLSNIMNIVLTLPDPWGYPGVLGPHFENHWFRKYSHLTSKHHCSLQICCTANQYPFFFIFLFPSVLGFRGSIYDCDITKFNVVASLILESNLGALLEYPIYIYLILVGRYF